MKETAASANMAAQSAAQLAEERRLAEDERREKYWTRFGTYLSERQWGTVREDYSPDGAAWSYFPHEHARSRAYRWGEDGLLGFCDRQCRMCFALALWNGKDPILKERLFGLSGPEGNHGEDAKELYFYLDATPTYSYVRGLYKYPQAPFPYTALVEENRKRSKREREFELTDTGVLDAGYFDVSLEYAKASPEDLAIRVAVTNRGKETATIWVLPTLWFRNTWSWGRTSEEHDPRPSIRAYAANRNDPEGLRAEHKALGTYRLLFRGGPDGERPRLLFTENETNTALLFGSKNGSPYVKDAFHAYVVEGREEAVNPAQVGTKSAGLYKLTVEPEASAKLDMRLFRDGLQVSEAFGNTFESILAERRSEADAFYAARIPPSLSAEERNVARQAYAGLLWSKQFYHYIVPHWLEGDPAYPPPPLQRASGRNSEWTHLYNRDVISMPDKWEYPWYAAWDLAFHMIPFARIDLQFAQQQLELFLREWYMHPNGQMPAYEWALSDVNPPVHAWAAWRVYKKSGPAGQRDVAFLERVFQKLLLNFTWWVNRKDRSGKHVFAGGFLGLDNIGVFDRSAPLPGGGYLDQADGTAWMAFYCGTMLSIALELASRNPAYEDMASKFFEHFIAIADAMNSLDGTGLWDEQDGFYYDRIHVDGHSIPLRVRSLVGVIPLIAAEIVEQGVVDRLGGFKKRMEWFLRNRPDLAQHIGYMDSQAKHKHRLLSIPSRERLSRVLRYLLDEQEFLSPFGLRSVSKHHAEHPYVFQHEGREHRVDYAPGEGTTELFGGNSNWRGPIWFPINFLVVEALERYHLFYGDSFQVEFPFGSGQRMNLDQVAREIAVRLTRPFLPDATGARPCHGGDRQFAQAWRELLLFHEYFHADTGRGLGASHQTGWTALVASLLDGLSQARSSRHVLEKQAPAPAPQLP